MKKGLLNQQKQKKEDKLVKQLRAGNKKAVLLWFKQYHQYLFSIAVKKLPSKEDAEEIVQETFVNCLKNLNQFRGKSLLKTWMTRILSHQMADFFRKQYAKKAIRVLPLSELLLDYQFANAHETSIRVKRVLGKMKSHKQELLKMKYVDKIKIKDMAIELNKSVKSIESDLFRARNEFRRLYLEID